MSAIIPIVALVYVALIALLTALPARKHHWSMVLARTGIVIVSAVVSVPLSKFVAAKIGQWLYGVVEPKLPADLQTFMNEVPLAAESTELIVSLLLAPILFLLLFIAIRAVLGLVALIIERVFPKLRRKSLRNATIAVPIGAVNGILVALVTLIPLCGYMTMGSSCLTVYHLFDEQGVPTPQEEVMASVPDRVRVEPLSERQSFDQESLINTIENIGDNTVIKFLNNVGTPLFDEMTSGTLDGGNMEFSLTKEIPHLADSTVLLLQAAAFVSDGDVTQEDTDALVSAVQTLLSSDWVAEVAADSISFIADTWQDGGDFMGMKAPDAGPMLQPVIDTALTVLSTESAETLRSDVETVLNVLTDLIAIGFLSDDLDYEMLLSELGKDGLISEIMDTLSANPHMAPLAEEVKTVSVKVISSVLGETLKNTEEYDPLIKDVANQLTDIVHMSKEEREPIVREAIKAAFAEYGVAVPEDVAVEFSEKALAEVGKDGVVDADELKQYLVDNIDEGLGLTDGVLNDQETSGSPDFGF